MAHGNFQDDHLSSAAALLRLLNRSRIGDLLPGQRPVGQKQLAQQALTGELIDYGQNPEPAPLRQSVAK
jgi:hypothetical protein